MPAFPDVLTRLLDAAFGICEQSSRLFNLGRDCARSLQGWRFRDLGIAASLAGTRTSETDEAVIQQIDRLLDHHTDREIAAVLNQKGMRSGEGKSFQTGIVVHLRHDYNLADRFSRLRARGMLTTREIADRLGISVASVKAWRDRGLLRAHRFNDKGECLFEQPPQDLPPKSAWKRSYLQKVKQSANAAEEVQYEA